MISGTYKTISLNESLTAEFSISYSNQMLSSYLLYRENGRYGNLIELGKTTLKDNPDENEVKRAEIILNNSEKIKSDDKYARLVAQNSIEM